MALVSATPYLALLSEQDPSLKSYALTSLNEIVDQLWAEIANNITDLEELYEDKSFEKRALAALIISKVYYNLGDFEASLIRLIRSLQEMNSISRSNRNILKQLYLNVLIFIRLCLKRNMRIRLWKLIPN